MSRITPVTACALLCLQAAAPVWAQDRDDDVPTVRIGGLIAPGVFVQDALFTPGNGQNAQLVLPDPAPGWWHGADVRDTRLHAEVTGITAGQWAIAGRVEFDLFGGFPSGAEFDREQAYLRLRLAWAEFDHGGTRLRLGQDWAPLSHDMPASVTRQSFPPGWGAAGVIGWRFPGVFISRQLAAGDVATLRLEAAAMRGAGAGVPEDPERPTPGQAALVPQLQAALVAGAAEDAVLDWGLRLGGHADRRRAPEPGAPDPASGHGIAGSGHVSPGRLTVRAGGYAGHALGQLAAHASQVEDVGGHGLWGQLEVRLGEAWGVRGFAGRDEVRDSDVVALDEGILDSRTTAVELWHDAEVWAVGLEWQHVRTHWWDAAAGGGRRVSGNQLAAGAVVRF